MTWEKWIGTVKQGDCLELMKQMPDGVVHTTVTSIPYYGLRDYGISPTKWPAVDYSPMPGLPAIHIPEMECCYGLEPTPEAYVGHGVLVFRGLNRIMHPTGTLWLNMGDGYFGGRCAGSQPKDAVGAENARQTKNVSLTCEYCGVEFIGYPTQRFCSDACGGVDNTPRQIKFGLKPKDLLEMPSRLVLALQADGWWLRSRIPWLKRNAMPESCQDRPTQAVEYVFLLSKSKSYFYDGEAVRVKNQDYVRKRSSTFKKSGSQSDEFGRHCHGQELMVPNPSGRSRRNSDWFMESWQGLWTDENGEPLAFIVNPKPYKRAHFATFSPGLVIPCLKAGTSERGACPECGSPWVRVKRPTDDYLTNLKGYYPHRNQEEVDGFSEYLKEQRKKTGLSKAEIDRQLGLNTAYSWWEGRLSGNQLPDHENYSKLKQLLQLDDRFDHLFEFIEGGKEKGGWCKDGTDALSEGNTKEGLSLVREYKTLGWRPACSCGKEPLPCLAFDPFAGTGTVIEVARKMGRSGLGFEISEEYVKKYCAERLAQGVLGLKS